jgi:hypothetical protein
LTKALIRIAIAAGPHFAEAVDTILPLIAPLERADLFLYRYGRTRDNADGENLVKSHPETLLKLLDAVIGDSPEHVPYELRETLDTLAEFLPSTRQDPRWRRLSKLAA